MVSLLIPVFHLGQRRLRLDLFLISLSDERSERECGDERSECDREHAQKETSENDAKETMIHRHQADQFSIRSVMDPTREIPASASRY